MAAKKTTEVKKEIEATELRAKNAVKAAAAKAKAAEKKAEKAVKTTAAKTKAAAKKTAEDTKAAAKKTATKIEEKKAATGKAKAKKTEFVIQSPMGGEITTDEIMKKVPKDAEYIYVRVDQNKIWWTRGEESGSVDIW